MVQISVMDGRMSPFYFKCVIFCNESKRNKKLVLAWLSFSSQRPSGITQSDVPAVLGGCNADRTDSNPDRDVCTCLRCSLFVLPRIRK
jgi:hypothetical protein